MSPTSYQAAPPRTSTIADAARSVKFGKTKIISLKEELTRSYTECRRC